MACPFSAVATRNILSHFLYEKATFGEIGLGALQLPEILHVLCKGLVTALNMGWPLTVKRASYTLYF
jgi:hypothetical protein